MKTHTSDTDLKSLSSTGIPTDVYEKCLSGIRNMFGNVISEEQMKYYITAANGNMQIIVNHVLNDIEKGSKSNSGKKDLVETLVSELSDELQCSICLSFFENPVMLDCVHTFCLTCLQALVTDSSRIPCPLCRKVQELDEKGVEGLKPNHYIANIIDKLRTSQISRLCGVCQKEQCNILCKNCAVFMCNACAAIKHTDKDQKKHTFIAVDELLRHTPFERTNSSEEIIGHNPSPVSPDWIVPFAIRKDACSDIFYQWIQSLWFAPLDLANSVLLKSFRPLLVPFYVYDVEMTIKYSITFDWSVLSVTRASPVGTFDTTISLALCAARESTIIIAGGPGDLAGSTDPENNIGILENHLAPWKFDKARNLTIHTHTEGARVVPCDLQDPSAIPGAPRSELWREKLLNSAKETVLQKLKLTSSQVRNFSVDYVINHKRTRRVYAPLFSTCYEYRGRKFEFVINGASAKCYGQRPYSAGKLFSLGVTGVSALGLLAGVRGLKAHP